MPNGQRLLSESQHKESWSPQTIMPVSEQDYKDHRTHFKAYGLGWRSEDYYGLRRILHGGGMGGMFTQLAMLPELDIGIVVLTNQGTDMGAINSIIDNF